MGTDITRALQDLALLLLGIFAGAMLVIGVAFVGFWRAIDPGEFLAWFAQHAHRIATLMLPLGVSATVAAIASAAATWRVGGAARSWSMAAAVLAALVIAVYLAVHHPLNEAFAASGFPPNEVTGALAVWARWHWIRVALGIAAFAAQIFAVGACGDGSRA